jgi:hypothetical protein
VREFFLNFLFGFVFFGFDFLCLFGIWCLEFGIYHLIFTPVNQIPPRLERVQTIHKNRSGMVIFDRACRNLRAVS